MRLHVLSDIHLEHAPFTPPEVDADLLVLAGDTAPGTAGIEAAKRWLDARGGGSCLYLAGNHEFYGHTLPALVDDLREAAQGTEVHVLEGDELVIHGVRFLGCTLWSDFEFAGAQQRERSMQICERLVNDYKQIRASAADRRLKPEDTRALHLQSREWLSSKLHEHHDGPTVVITHHAPIVRPRPSNELLAALGGAFATDLSELIGADLADLWIFGHIHRCVDVDVNGTRVLSNQRGYPHEPVDGFDPALVIEL